MAGSEFCYEPCTAEDRATGSAGASAAGQPPPSAATALHMPPPFTGMLPGVYLHDHFYMAARSHARPLFDHQALVVERTMAPMEAKVSIG